MPLFFFCSGYFFQVEEPLLMALKKRFKRLYIPYLKWAISIFIVIALLTLYGINTTLLNNYTYNLNESFIKYCAVLLYSLVVQMGASNSELFVAFWFFKCLFWSSVLTSCAAKIAQKLFKEYYLWALWVLWLASAALCVCAKETNLKVSVLGNIYLLSMSMFFYLSGFFWRKNEKKQIYSIGFSVIGFACLFIVAIFFKNISVMFCEPNKVVFSLFIALIGILSTFAVSYRLQKYSFNWLYYIGNKTLVIFTWHFLFFRLFGVVVIKINGLPADTPMFDNFVVNMPFYYRLFNVFLGLSAPLLLNFLYGMVKQKIGTKNKK